MDLLEAKDAALSYLKASNTEVLKWFRTEINVETKPDQSPVTIADRKVEEILRKKIAKAFPDHGIIGEEFGEDGAGSEWVWTIDPIDGTRSFIRGLPMFASLIALLHKGEPVLGIISLPALGETAWAVQGHGAYCGNRKLNVSSHGR
ncbi:MAG: inositol monophosphatase family protein, partial [Nitrospinaceae bacterium]|nr:inositol monophosphatase family protein [Nitrospinaceae bacterium]